MENTLYQVTGIVMPKSEIKGYQIKKAGEVKVISVKSFKILVAKHQVDGFRLIREPKQVDELNKLNENELDKPDFDDYIVSDDIELKNIPIIHIKSKYSANELEAIEKVLNDDLEVNAYILKDSDNNKHKFSSLDTWELARRGCVVNLKATSFEVEQNNKVNKVKVLAGKNGLELYKLPYTKEQKEEQRVETEEQRETEEA